MQTKKRKRKFCIRYFIHSVVQPEDNKNSVIFTIAESWLYQRRDNVVYLVWRWPSYFLAKFCLSLMSTVTLRAEPPFCLLEWGGEKEALAESRQTFDVATAQFLWTSLKILFYLVKLVFSSASIRW